MGVYPELHTLGLAELVQRFFSPPPEGDAYADSYYLEVAEHLGTCEEKGVSFSDSSCLTLTATAPWQCFSP